MICDLSLKNTLLFNFVILEKNKKTMADGGNDSDSDSINV